MRAAIPFLLLFLASVSFAGQLWVFSSDGAITSKPILYGNRIVFGNEKGFVYAIEAGEPKWSQKYEGAVVDDPALLGDKVVVATADAVHAIDSSGAASWNYPLREIRGIAAAQQEKIYVASGSGITALDNRGQRAWAFNATDATEPCTDIPGYVVFGSGRKLIALRNTGEKFWEKEVGPFWNTRPMGWAGKVYAGSGEGKLYAIDVAANAISWEYDADGMITTTPAHAGAYIIFGTANGWVYAVNNGELAWKRRLDSMPEGEMAVDGNIVYLSTRKSLYGISGSDGSVVVKRQFLDWPHSPSVIKGQVVLGAEDGKLYAIDSSRACSFLYPEQDAIIGDADIEILGKSYSKYGGARTYVRAQGGEWKEVGGEEWSFGLDPSAFPYGVIEVECYVADSAGMENPPFSKLQLVKGDAPKLRMRVQYPTAAREGEPFNITVVDFDGYELSGITAVIGGESFTGDGRVEITPKRSGLQELTVSKKGYEDVKAKIDVKPQPTLAYVFIFLFVAAAIAYAYFGYIKK